MVYWYSISRKTKNKAMLDEATLEKRLVTRFANGGGTSDTTKLKLIPFDR